MSGEETMAQVYREIEHPKLKNLEKAGFVIFVYSLIFTAGVAFFAVMIIPDAVRSSFFDNPIGGLAMYLVGPAAAADRVPRLRRGRRHADAGRRGEHVDRRIERRAEPRVRRRHPAALVPPAASPLRHLAPHPESGRRRCRSLTIVLSRGNIFILGEAYAFGVMWSFAMKGLAVLVLRYKQPGEREFRVPLNLKIGSTGNSRSASALITLISVRALHHQSVHEAGGDDLRRRVHADLLRDLHALGTTRRRKRATAHAELDQFNLDAGRRSDAGGAGRPARAACW